MLKRIAVLGEIGSGNLGDDLGYVLLRDAISHAVGNKHILLDFRPLTPNMFRLLPGYHWDAVMTGCGTLLDAASGPYVRALLAASETAPIFIVGTGLADERHIPPTTQGVADLSRLLRIAKWAWLRSVRPVNAGTSKMTEAAFTEHLSMWQLRSVMARLSSGPDPFWLYGWRGTDNSERVDVGINDGPVAFGDLRSWRDKVASLRGRHCHRLVAAWRDDIPVMQSLLTKESHANANPVSLVSGTESSTAVMNTLRSLVTTRVHLGALAACHGVMPVLPDYSVKVSEILQSGVNVPVRILPHTSELVEMESACFDVFDRDAMRGAILEAQNFALEAVRKVAMMMLETLTR